MAKVSFGSTDSTATAEAPVEVLQPVATPAPATPVSPLPVATAPAYQPPATTGSSYSDSADDIDFDQIRLPTLKIVQGVGELSKSFLAGQIVLQAPGNVLVPLADAPPKAGVPVPKGATPPAPQTPVRFYVLAVRKTDRYSESTPQGSTERGRLVNSEQEVYAAGGTTNYNDSRDAAGTTSVKPWFKKIASALLLVRKPEGYVDDTAAFTIEVGSHLYALAIWHLQGSAYTAIAVSLRSARKIGYLKAGWSARGLNLTTNITTFRNGNSAYVPQVVPAEPSTPEELASLAEVLKFAQS